MIPAPVLWKLLDAGLLLLEVGLSREAVVAKVKEQEEAGATGEQITAFIVKMREDAKAKAFAAKAK